MTTPIKVNRKPYQWLKAGRKPRVFMWGSASSSKSHTIAQFIGFELFARLDNVGILIVRKTRPAVKDSCWELITGYLDKAGIKYKPNLSELKIVGRNGSWIKFDGLDNIAKKKSMEGLNFIWVEELFTDIDAILDTQRIVQLPRELTGTSFLDQHLIVLLMKADLVITGIGTGIQVPQSLGITVFILWIKYAGE